jgi:DNA-binding response OmpR family regulator
VCRKPNILIVDDEEPTLLAMSEYFTDRGFTVDCSRDSGEAEALLMANAYAAMITDLELAEPGERQGLHLISLARTRRPDICIILLTGYEYPQVEAEARRLGADAFVLKPRPMSELRQTVCDLLTSRPRSCQRSSLK